METDSTSIDKIELLENANKLEKNFNFKKKELKDPYSLNENRLLKLRLQRSLTDLHTKMRGGTSVLVNGYTISRGIFDKDFRYNELKKTETESFNPLDFIDNDIYYIAINNKLSTFHNKEKETHINNHENNNNFIRTSTRKEYLRKPIQDKTIINLTLNKTKTNDSIIMNSSSKGSDKKKQASYSYNKRMKCESLSLIDRSQTHLSDKVEEFKKLVNSNDMSYVHNSNNKIDNNNNNHNITNNNNIDSNIMNENDEVKALLLLNEQKLQSVASIRSSEDEFTIKSSLESRLERGYSSLSGGTVNLNEPSSKQQIETYQQQIENQNQTITKNESNNNTDNNDIKDKLEENEETIISTPSPALHVRKALNKKMNTYILTGSKFINWSLKLKSYVIIIIKYYFITKLLDFFFILIYHTKAYYIKLKFYYYIIEKEYFFFYSLSFLNIKFLY